MTGPRPEPSLGADVDWAQEGAHEIVEGVYRLPLELPDDALRAVNVYAVVDGDRLALVDAGWQGDHTSAQMERVLGAVGLRRADVDRVFVTHVHRDHYSEAMTLRRLSGARIMLGAAERPNLEAVLRAGPIQQAYFDHLRALGAGALVSDIVDSGYSPTGYSGDWEPPDEWLEDDTVLELKTRRLRVIATPGHTRGHVVFHDEANGLLFAGDHVLPHITPSIGLEPAGAKLPLADYLRSLDLMLALHDCTLLPAHGGPTVSVHARARELLAHHDQRLADTLAQLGSAGDTAYDVARRLAWTRRQRSFDSLEMFHQMLATGETAAHLDVLVTRSLVSVDLVDGLRVYRRAEPG